MSETKEDVNNTANGKGIVVFEKFLAITVFQSSLLSSVTFDMLRRHNSTIVSMTRCCVLSFVSNFSNSIAKKERTHNWDLTKENKLASHDTAPLNNFFKAST